MQLNFHSHHNTKANMNFHRYNKIRSDVVTLLLIVSVAHPSLSLSLSSRVVLASEEKVKVTLYYEALCPACADFIVNDLYKIFDNGLISIVDLKLSPYGNAKITSNGTIVCQHGGWECLLNTIEACSIHAWPLVSDHFPFISCIEKLSYEERYTEWNTCFKKLDMNPKPVIDCYTSGMGHKLELQYADEITALQPPHEYVPWIVVDGKPLSDDYIDFISFICKAYKGSNVPRACRGTSCLVTASMEMERVKSFNNVCYTGEDDVKLESKAKSPLLEIISSTIASWMVM